MKVFFYTMVIFLLPSSIYGQGKWDDCLSPTGGTQFASREYESSINDIVLSHFTDYQVLRFRSGERFWAIEWNATDSENGKYSITYLKPSERIWQSSSNPKEITVKKVSKSLEVSDYKLVNNMFNEALKSVSSNCANLGIDGGTYVVSNHRTSGKIWTGGPLSLKTKKERMVKICLQISDLIVDQKRNSLKLSKKLKSEILNLTSDFKKFNAEKRSFWN